jgi:hypothetical protein
LLPDPVGTSYGVCPGTQKIGGRNFEGFTDAIRDNYQDIMILWDWLRPLMTATQVQQLVTAMNTALELQIYNFNAGGTIIGHDAPDADQVFSSYFAAAAYPLLQGMPADNPNAGHFVNDVTPGHFGGYDLSIGQHGRLDTFRKCVLWYINPKSVGGEFPISTEYNHEYIFYLMGAESIKTATGVDHYTEWTAILSDLAKMFILAQVPDVSQEWSWGDVQINGPAGPPWSNRGFQSVTYQFNRAAFLAGLLQGTKTGEYIQDFVQTFTVAQSATSGGTAFRVLNYNGIRGMLTFNPYAPRSDYRQVLSGYAPGKGLLLYHTGWNNATDSLWGTTFREDGHPIVNYHQGWGPWGNFQLWRRGEWALTHPQGYGSQVVAEAIALNGIKHSGLSGANDIRVRGADIGENYAYSWGSMGGQYDIGLHVRPPFPPVFLYEHTRELLYLPSTDKLSDTILIYDRTSEDDPRDQQTQEYINASFDSWSAEHILRSPRDRTKQWIIHMPVEPRLNERTLTWRTQGGQSVRTEMLLPTDGFVRLVDEGADASTSLDFELGATFRALFDATEVHWQARLRPATKRRWDTFLNVVQVWNSTPRLTNTLVTGTNNSQGVLVQRGAHNDVLAIFNGIPLAGDPPTPSATNHWRQTGFAVTWSAASQTTECYVADLDPGRTWMYQLGGGAITPLPVSANGLGRVSLATAAGALTLTVSAP